MRESALEFDFRPSKEAWNAVKRKSRGDYRQRFEYGEALARSDPRVRVLRLLAKRDGNPVGIVQGIYRPNMLYGGRLLVGGSSGGAPIVTGDVDRGQATDAMLDEMEGMARRRMVADAWVYAFQFGQEIEAFLKKGYRVRRRLQIFFVALDERVDAVWPRMAPNKRRKIRRAEGSNVRVEAFRGLSDLEVAYRMYTDFAAEKKFRPRGWGAMVRIWEEFGRVGDFLIFMAKVGERPVACATVIIDSDTLFCPMTCSNDEGRARRANDLLHWKIIEWGCRNGFKRYNMGEVFADPSHPQHGVYRWKREYGGYIEEMALLEKPFLPGLGRIAGFARSIGRFADRFFPRGHQQSPDQMQWMRSLGAEENLITGSGNVGV